MKKIIGFIVMSLFVVAAYAQEAEENKSGAKIKFEVSSHDFGDVTQGEKVEYIFAFENTGTEPLILSNVITTCGCTAPNWPRDPIAPGTSGNITITYNSAGKMGVQSKIIRVVSNADTPEHRLTIKANVIPKKS